MHKYLLLFFLVTALQVQSQVCSNIDTLKTQSDVDQFRANYGTCTTIDGNLNIIGSGIDPSLAIHNLDSLIGITAITGNLLIVNQDSLTDISSLSGLISIGDSLRIIGNDVLEDLTGLHNLETIGKDLEVCCTGGGPANFEDLGNVISIGGNVRFCCSSSFQETKGMNSLVSIGGSLTICCAEFNEINGFPNLISIGDSLDICCMGNLYSISGFPKLRKIENSLRIESSSNLEMIGGLNQLTYVGGNVVIENLPSLISACGLYNLLDEVDHDINGPGTSPPDVGGLVIISGSGSITDISDILEEGPCFLIPTISQWGLVSLIILLLIIGNIVMKQKLVLLVK